MIVVSASAPRSGSVWYVNMTNDLLITAGHADALKIREQFKLESLMEPFFVGGNLRFAKLARLMIPHFMGKTYVFKTHHYPTRGLRLFTELNVFRATYIYRDPRDRLVSLMDRNRKLHPSLSEEDRFEAALSHVQSALQHYNAWATHPGVLITRYEDLVADTMLELSRLAKNLNLDVSEANLQTIISWYARDNNVNRKFSHLNVGGSGRFQKNLTDDQIDHMYQKIGADIEQLGYQL